MQYCEFNGIGELTMKPIIGEFHYPEMTEAEIQRYVREAERMRS